MVILPKKLPTDVDQLQALLLNQQHYIFNLEAKVRMLEFRRFAARSELIHPGQKSLFDEVEREAAAAIAEELPVDNSPENSTTIPEHQRRRPTRKPLPAELERVPIHHDLSDTDKICALHGCSMKEIGTEISEQLDIIPAIVRVLQHIRHKYTCPECEGNIKLATMPEQMIPKSMASAGLLAHIAVSKYEDSLPLYRQENIFDRCGVELSRGTMARWMIACSERLMPLLNLMRDHLLDSGYLQCDETIVQVLKEEDRPAERKSYMWTMASIAPGKNVVLYEYRSSRSGKTAQELLEGFKGYLQTDGFAGYNLVAKNEDVIHLGCWAHVRRKFYEASKSVRKGSKDGISIQALALIQHLYKIESKIEEFLPEAKVKERQSRAGPILAKFRQLLDANIALVPPKSYTGKALNYAMSEWEKLTRYINDGRLKIDNNFIENKIRPFCLGRKNWLFSDTVDGANASAALYSIIITAKANGLDAYTFLRHLFERLPLAQTVDEFESLLPWNFKTTIH